MKKTGILFFGTANLYLLYFYAIDLFKYFSDQYYNDGIRYFIPLLMADAIFLVALIFILLSSKINKFFFGYILLAILHNLITGLGISNIPFTGISIIIITGIYIFKVEGL